MSSKKGNICHYGEMWHITRNFGNGPDFLIWMRGLQMSSEIGLDINTMSQKEVKKTLLLKIRKCPNDIFQCDTWNTNDMGHSGHFFFIESECFCLFLSESAIPSLPSFNCLSVLFLIASMLVKI